MIFTVRSALRCSRSVNSIAVERRHAFNSRKSRYLDVHHSGGTSMSISRTAGNYLPAKCRLIANPPRTAQSQRRRSTGTTRFATWNITTTDLAYHEPSGGYFTQHNL
jgi:hypothetical protein